ncbi:MAG: CvpA family protein [Firmicutes bacterium]|nr:CvpA family protein [Bacillota bacterium]
MNLSDIAVVAIILGFALVGLKTGFILSIFKIASYFISIWISLKFYPKVAELLMKTKLFENIKTSILDNLLKQKAELISQTGQQVKEAAVNTVIEKLPLPEFLKGNIINQVPEPGKLIDVNKVMEIISGELAKIIIYIISMVLLYLAVRIAIVIVKHLLEGITKLPVFKQLDKLGGFALGAVEGLLTVYIVFAILMLFNSVPSFRQIHDAIGTSTIAKFFYENNFIIDFMFPGKGI